MLEAWACLGCELFCSHRGKYPSGYWRNQHLMDAFGYQLSSQTFMHQHIGNTTQLQSHFVSKRCIYSHAGVKCALWCGAITIWPFFDSFLFLPLYQPLLCVVSFLHSKYGQIVGPVSSWLPETARLINQALSFLTTVVVLQLVLYSGP